MMDTLKRIKKIIRESAFNKKKKKPGLKFNPGLALTGVRTTGPSMEFLSFKRRGSFSRKGESSKVLGEIVVFAGY